MDIDNTLLDFDNADIFTPDNISKIMSSYLLNEGNLLEPSVGYGNLLKFININNYNNIDIYDIKQSYLDKCIEHININKYNEDFITSNNNNIYDNIILNPPYIKIQNLSPNYRNIIKNMFPILNKGNIDIYYAFILKCINLLNNKGIMVSITPNSYLYNKSSINLRKYLIDNKYIQEIIDYNTEKVFNNISAYCCITIFSKTNKKFLIYNNKKIYYKNISTNEYNIFSNNIQKNISINKIILGDICNIRNGIATLRDKIYIHSDKLFDEPCWKQITNLHQIKWCIFPYNPNGTIIPELEFKKCNKKTYNYLLQNKEELAKRDKGHKKYPEWYSYGRTQSLKISNNKKVIYIPTFTNPDNILYKIDIPLLFIGCLCLEITNNLYTPEYIINLLKNNKDYIVNNSSKRGGGWINISGRILKQIVIS